MIKIILIDTDGVLINGKTFSKELEKDYAITTEKTKDFFTNVFPKCLQGEADLKESIEPFIKEWGWQKTVEELLDYWFKTEHSLDEKLVKYLQSLRSKGIRCFVATNQEKYRTQYLLDKMGFKDSFDGVFSSSSLGAKKPSLEFFQKVYNLLVSASHPGGVNLKLSEILFWDDKEENILAAREFGINAEIYTNFEDFLTKIHSYNLPSN